MNAGKCLLTILALVFLVGCRTDPNITLLERELRLQEKEIDRLKWSLEDADAEVRTLQRENEGLRQGAVSHMPYPSSSAPPRPSGPPVSDIPPGAVMVPPEVEVPKTFVPEGEVPETLRPRSQRSSSGEPRREPAGRESTREPGREPTTREPGREPTTREPSVEPPHELPSIESKRRGTPATGDGPSLGGPQASRGARRLPVVKGDSRQVAKIALNPQLTGGFRAGGARSDDGLAVVIEPRDARGRLVEAAGDISVVALDPSGSGPGARVGRWDFTAADAKQLFRNDAIQGIQLEVPWPDNNSPKLDKLHLYVRYKTADGRKLQTDRMIPVDMAVNEPRRLPVGDPSTGEGPALLATRKPENWRTAANPPRPAAIAPSEPADVAPVDPQPPRSLAERNAAERNSEPAPLMASRPAPPSAPPQPKPPALQRPVWSPERP